MKVDMSPKAVKARLLELNDLWELSIKLMNCKKEPNASSKLDKKESGDNLGRRRKPNS